MNHFNTSDPGFVAAVAVDVSIVAAALILPALYHLIPKYCPKRKDLTLSMLQLQITNAASRAMAATSLLAEKKDYYGTEGKIKSGKDTKDSKSLTAVLVERQPYQVNRATSYGNHRIEKLLNITPLAGQKVTVMGPETAW